MSLLLSALLELLMYSLLSEKKKCQLSVPITIVDHKSDEILEFFSGTHLTKIRITSLQEAIENDISIKEVMDLPLGYSAKRINTDSKWIRYKTSQDNGHSQKL